MRQSDHGAFVSLREFWAETTHTLCASAPPAADPATLGRALDQHFGGLAEHAVQSLGGFPIEVSCTSCRNNDDARRESVCETHVGTLQGLFEAALDRPLTVQYRPGSLRQCSITVDVLRSEKGGPLVSWLCRSAHVRVESAAEAWAVVDARTGERTPVNQFAARLLDAATTPVPAAVLGARLCFEPQLLLGLIKDARNRRWIEVEFGEQYDEHRDD